MKNSQHYWHILACICCAYNIGIQQAAALGSTNYMIVSDSVTTGSHTAESNNYTIESGESAMQVSGCTNEYQEVPIATANGSPTCATTSSTSSSSSVPVNQGTGGGNSGGGDGGGNGGNGGNRRTPPTNTTGGGSNGGAEDANTALPILPASLFRAAANLPIQAEAEVRESQRALPTQPATHVAAGIQSGIMCIPTQMPLFTNLCAAPLCFGEAYRVNIQQLLTCNAAATTQQLNLQSSTQDSILWYVLYACTLGMGMFLVHRNTEMV